ncbi:nucleotidyl transferase AbiEii/AbiGii toxin family protein [Streptomyces sp. NBC_01451]|uniref:nucleotidyl transferase AbiEii/AbiGii toxin family protein n=1 Tax=Streptomyces sp. NBC_01451 TaxID=2903872 RepID=UPI002E374771|nr:nucleotidyl transferase AbiEii/AbiGii toxin family protein [Streptomyces sp. NBC_01451]
MNDGYATPGALDTALKHHAKKHAKNAKDVGALRRAFFFQRLAARVFVADPDGWMIKGGQALLLRYSTDARLSKDIDILRADSEASIEEAVQALKAAAAVDLGDHLTFVPTGLTMHGDEEGGANQAFIVQLGPRKSESIRVDLVVGRTPTAIPQVRRIEPAVPMPWPDDWPEVRLYPVVDHLADKICAMYEWHGTIPSSRFRDLADLLLISQREVVDGVQARHALRTEAARRIARGKVRLELPDSFKTPHPSWRTGYPRAARDVSGLKDCATWEAAETAAAEFLPPLLGSEPIGTWDPADRRWRDG